MSKISELNDQARKVYFNRALFGQKTPGHEFIMTPSVSGLSQKAKLKLFDAVIAYDNFNHDIDPHGEHDMGRIEQDGESYYWKFDYYDASMEYGSPDSADPSVTTRVMTILNVHEY